MEQIRITASELSRLDKIMSIPGCFSGDVGTENVNFDGIKCGDDTPINFNGRTIGTVPRHAIATGGNRLRAASGKLSDRSILPMLKNQLFSTGATLEVLQSDGGMIQKSVLKSFDISVAGDVPQAQGRTRTDPTYTAGPDTDEIIADRIFGKTRGCAPSQSEQQPTDRLKLRDDRSDAAIADAIYLRSGGGDQRDPGGASARTQQTSESEDDAIANRLFSASGGR